VGVIPPTHPMPTPYTTRPSTTFGLLGMLRRSIVHRRRRSFSALVALTVSAAVATALLTLFADLDQKLHHEFRAFGANIVVTSPVLMPDALSRARDAAGPDANLAEFAYAVASTDRGTSVVVAGVNFPAVRRLDASWWQLPAWPTVPDAALLGERAAGFVANEHAVTLTYAGKPETFAGAGHLKTGGDEDSRIYIPLPIFEQWTGVQPTVIEVQIPGGTRQVESALTRLRAALPGSTVAPVRQLVEGESNIVDRTHALMFGAVLLISLTVGVSVLSTLSASVLERRRDFALMKALGGPERHMLALFLLETAALALLGCVIGWLLGSAAAWAISEADFGTSALPRLGVLPVVLALNACIALLAAAVPIRALRHLAPAAILKGE
jgi:putative ABC transport system permease protein